MAISNTHIKQLRLGNDDYWISAKYLLDSSGVEHNFEELISLPSLDIKVVTVLPTASESTMGSLYLIAEAGTTAGTYVEYITVKTGDAEPYTYSWERIGTTATDLSDYSKKTHIHTVTPNSMSIGATAVNGSITFNTSKALGTNATFTTTVTPTTTNIKATASGAALSTSDADFVNGVTSSNASFLNSWGASVDANGVLSFSTSSTNALTGITPTTNKALISASVSTQPTISLGTGTGTGTVSVATGITSATTTTNSHDEVSAHTSVNVFTQPTIKINNEASVNVAAPTQVNTSADTSA